MSPANPRRQAARERVLNATIATLAASGFAGTTARSIAATGGFAPGVIYYHFADLDDLFLATMRFTSAARIARYRAATEGIGTAVEMLATLRELRADDVASGHIAAVQELIAAATASTPLATAVHEEVLAWEELAASVITALLAGTPFEELVPVAQAAQTAVATYLGLEMIAHLDRDQSRPAALFEAAAPAADLLDALRLAPPPPPSDEEAKNRRGV